VAALHVVRLATEAGNGPALREHAGGGPVGGDFTLAASPADAGLGEALLEPSLLFFFQGWKPLPTAASARGGGDLLDSLLHCAASIANGDVLCSCNKIRWKFSQSFADNQFGGN
jgi:hypothetical protein